MIGLRRFQSSVPGGRICCAAPMERGAVARREANASARYFRFYGMRRSGNHAVIAWLRRNLGAPSLFLNDCLPGDPFDSFQYIELGDVRRGTPFRKNGGQDAREKADAAELRDVVVSYEDQPPPSGPRKLRNWTRGFGEPDIWHDIMVWRSLPNWLASFMRLVLSEQAGPRRGCTGPLQIAGYMATYGKMMEDIAAQKVSAVHFDRWVEDPDYRVGVLSDLKLPVLDNGLGESSPYGGGSSFSSNEVEPANVGERWRMLANDPAYRALAELALNDGWFMSAVEMVDPGVTRTMEYIANSNADRRI